MKFGHLWAAGNRWSVVSDIREFSMNQDSAGDFQGKSAPPFGGAESR